MKEENKKEEVQPKVVPDKDNRWLTEEDLPKYEEVELTQEEIDLLDESDFLSEEEMKELGNI